MRHGNVNLDTISLGGKRKEIHTHLPSPSLYKALEEVQNKNHKRAQEVFGFYDDLWETCKLMAPLVKKGSFAFLLVGNRRVQGVELPTDIIMAEFFESLGYKHEVTYVREIGNKRMPYKNSPSNVAGEKDVTMRYEYLVKLKRVG
jgi:hypothetical protein